MLFQQIQMSNEFYLKNIYEYKYSVFHKSNKLFAKFTLSIIAKKIKLFLKEQDTKDISGNYYIFDVYISVFLSLSIYIYIYFPKISVV